MCDKCVDNISNAHEFKRICEESDERLRTKKTEVVNDILFIKDSSKNCISSEQCKDRNIPDFVEDDKIETDSNINCELFVKT